MSLSPLDCFIRASDAIVQFEAFFNSLRDEELDIYILEVQSSEAKSLWDKVKETYDQCLASIQLSGEVQENLESAQSKYLVAYKAYVNVIATANRKLDQFRSSQKNSNSSLAQNVASQPSLNSDRLSQIHPPSNFNTNFTSTPRRDAIPPEDALSMSGVSHQTGRSAEVSASNDRVMHSLNLPPCDIDVFSGDFLSWPTFRELFSVVYIDNSRLSDIEKLCYLLKKTSGEAKDIVSKFPLTHKSFALAWSALKETYDNVRILVNNQLKLLFDLPVLDTESSAGLKNLQRAINGCISAMAIYDVSTNDWDPILVFLCIQRLPKPTVTLWEQTVKDKSALSAWKDLDRFLTERIQTLSCLQNIRGIDSSKKVEKKVRAHFTKTAPSSSSSRAPAVKTCVLCPKLVHPLRFCSEFTKLSIEGRFSVMKRFNCCINCLTATISGINQSTSTTSQKICSLCIGSPIDTSIFLEIAALVIPAISGNLPSFTIGEDLISRLPNIRLADRNFFECRTVDLLLGADLYPRILLQGIQSNILGTLMAQKTVFGWIITGPIPSSNITVLTTTINYPEDDLNKTLLRFWELEEPPKRAILSPSDKFCEENFKRTTRRDLDGRYIVTLPIIPEFAGQLGHSRTNCLRQFFRNEASLLRKPQIKVVYDGVVREYLELDHMRLVPTSSADSSVCYLPHHPVINPDKPTTKLRVVFNASNKTSNGNSLNDILYVGPTLQLDLVLLILRWRLFKFVFNCDITQMYRQIRVDPTQTPLQRILFRDSPHKPVQDFELQTVTFGVNCAPYLAIRTLLQLADETENEFPLAAHILRKCMYVDDVLTGYHDLETAQKSRDQLIGALSSAKFELRKWTANDRSILESLPSEHLYDAKLLTFVEASSSKPLAQKAYYPEEYYALLHKKPLHSKSSLLSLNPFLDQTGVMRLDGRLAQSPTPSTSERHPILLPYHSRFAKLLVEQIHIESLHGGNQLMLRTLRLEYWIPRATSLIRATIRHCRLCILAKKRTCTQIMASLPPERTSISRPFSTTGIDFAGPFDIKSFSGRGCKITKGYVCVFVCFSTKAIHLEPASDLSTAAFLAAFNRFISRRGCPKTIFSDNGTNFVGASRELEREFKLALDEIRAKLRSKFQYQELSWKFNPAGAPHMGGLWEAAVKSFKIHFRKIAKNLKYTFEEFSTILTRIEACLNSRPLCPMNDSLDATVALTPGHFLIGSPILAPPEPIINESPLDIVNRYRKLKALSQQFCLRWKEEYLKSLHHRYKWKFPQRDIQLDDLVVLRQEHLPPTAWKLGRVVKVYPGVDGHVRVADVKTESGIVKRPVVKLVILTNDD
ncbi:uncharacterized protein [Musca autumnalis]|uniref:uncharacterized protein n=1 Tax=Musca autumnalis TaxID=221902 RepID=UPI003CE7897D